MSTESDLSTELAAVKAQLKEQTQQMAEMASMMKSMMSLAMPLLEEQTRKLYKEKAAEAALKKEKEAEAAREEKEKYAMWKRHHSYSWNNCMWELKDEYDHFQCRLANKKAAEQKAAKAAKAASLDWSCPDVGCVYPWTFKGTNYLRTSNNQVWREEADSGCGDWCGVYLIDSDRIDDSVEEPYFE